MKSKELLANLKEAIPNPICELNYNNNFELLCAVMLSAQTTDKRVNMVTPILFNKYPTPKELKNASLDDIINIIKSIGLVSNKSKNLINIARIIDEQYGGEVIPDFDILASLPGVGRKTASVVLAVGFKIPTFPVDTHVSRVSKRLGLALENDTIEVIEDKLKAFFLEEDWIDSHHLLLLFGRYFCTAKNSKCKDCKLIKYCMINAK